MSNLRIFWVAWCSFWALFWLLIGFFTIIGWLGVPLSLSAILIPVGQDQNYTPVRLPDCVRCGYAATSHINGNCPGPPLKQPDQLNRQA